MHRVRFALLVAVVLVSCKKAESFARVTVSSIVPLTAVARMHVTASIAQATSQFDVRGGTDAGPTFAIPPSRVFGVQIPATYGGTFAVHIDAYDDADILLASGDGQVGIAAGERRDVDVVLGMNPSDLGEPDLSASGPVLTLTPTSFVFPSANEGTTGTSTTFTLKNTGGETTAVLPAPVVEGTMAASFSISSNDCDGALLAPGDSCSVAVLYQPKSAGKLAAVLAVGAATSSLAATSVGTWHFDMMPVVADLSGGAGSQTHFLCVWGADQNTIFVGGSDGFLYQRLAGGSWSAKQYLGAVTVNGIWGVSPTNIFAVGSSTTLWHFEGSIWSDFHGNITSGAHPNFYAVGGTGASNILAGGDGNVGLTQSSGTSTWTDDPNAPAVVNSLWADPATGDVFTIDGTQVQRRHGTAWSLSYNATATLHAIWGASGNDVFAVGDGGTIVHYDGTNWNPPISAPPTFSYRGVWGTAGDDVFVVGDNGTILHSDGNNVWMAQTSHTAQTLNAIWGSGTGDVYAVGTFRLVLHYY